MNEPLFKIICFKNRFLNFEGFTNAKRVDASSNTEIKAALDKALMEQMQRISLKQKQAEKDAVSAVVAVVDGADVAVFVALSKIRPAYLISMKLLLLLLLLQLLLFL